MRDRILENEYLRVACDVVLRWKKVDVGRSTCRWGAPFISQYTGNRGKSMLARSTLDSLPCPLPLVIFLIAIFVILI